MSLTERTLEAEHRYSLAELNELRRSALWSARHAFTASERRQYRQIALSLRALLRSTDWLQSHTVTTNL
jgi:hypothetical protein